MNALNKILTDLFGTNKTCKFIGCNSSMGLINGELYNIKISSWKTSGIQIIWYDPIFGCMWCPYSSVNTFLQNWEPCCEGIDMEVYMVTEDNGREYEEYAEEVTGIFDSKEKAEEHVKSRGFKYKDGWRKQHCQAWISQPFKINVGYHAWWDNI